MLILERRHCMQRSCKEYIRYISIKELTLCGRMDAPEHVHVLPSAHAEAPKQTSQCMAPHRSPRDQVELARWRHCGNER
eukprot:70244-Chlamydomonas_euryale.AAC.4